MVLKLKIQGIEQLMRKSTIAILFALICLQSCSQRRGELVAPESLELIYKRVDEVDNIRSFILFKEGAILKEKYYKPYEADSLDHLRSATKSIMATLVGIAVDQGMIESIEDPIGKYIKDAPHDKSKIKIKHFMGMTSGIRWNEGSGYNDNNRMVDSGSPITHMMGLDLASKPGAKWNYSSGDIHVLSAVLSEAIGMSTQKFAEIYLFGPLGIENYKWQKLNDGYNHGGSRLELKPSDMLKIGILFSNGGVHEGNRIISASMIDLLTGIHSEFETYDSASAGYGYGWWTAQIEGSKLFMAAGYGGQMIIVSPDEQMVVVFTCNWKLGSEKAGMQEKIAQNIGKDTFLWFRQN